MRIQGWLLISLILFQLPPTNAAVPNIKVRIGKSLPNIMVAGMDLKKELHQKNKVKQYTGKSKVKLICKQNSRARRPAMPKPILLASLTSPSGLISWGENKYKGELNVISSLDQRTCDLVVKTSLEDYLSTLLAKEMDPAWPIEALKAQAVAARTYALYKMQTKEVSRELGADAHYDLENSEKHQVSGTFMDSTKGTKLASKETHGEILVAPNNQILPIFFHSKCGGKTLTPDEVWGGEVSGYVSVDCPYCHKHGKKNWKVSLHENRFKYAFEKVFVEQEVSLKSSATTKVKMMVAPDRYQNGLLRIYREDQLFVLNKSFVRKNLGRRLIPSNNIKVKKVGNRIHIEGKGHGHGVGMCQFGVLDMAQKGMNYKEILAHYFPNHKIERVY